MPLRVPAAQSGPLRFSFLAGKNAGDCYILDYAVMPFWRKHPLKGFRRVALNCFQIGNWAGKNKPGKICNHCKFQKSARDAICAGFRALCGLTACAL